MELLRVCDLKKSYAIENSRTMKREKVEVLKEISFEIAEGESLCIMGKSGCGKTTLLKILGGLLAPTDGGVFYKGEGLAAYGQKRMEAYRRTQVGFVFQDYKLLDHLTVFDNMILPLMLDHREVKESVSKVEAMAGMLQIGEKLDYYPNELSGGEKQRAAIGRALMNDPPLILADEPTGNLDEISGRMVMELLIKLQKNLQKTLVLVTHDREAADFCSRLITMKDGRTEAGGLTVIDFGSSVRSINGQAAEKRRGGETGSVETCDDLDWRKKWITNWKWQWMRLR